ncbi:hypothetical protein SISNIDRAFT_457875 [Sistotremastrum niveocremeum HHB9708]|uniref:DUF6593 domain-containing protein n=2 Tax=Sistotremastraceae TaxID=3402574 RepID=A0A164R8Q4_9AGAM|nr:hypothetical protein SISNIDRAFT_457875 [Sistotremastrum niveocremeum HHB9708]KZT42763.1 hypothetical protein SISSUDRAFT_1041013 [Sistotremastrum suecicum HHB10207 ss-3]
MDLSIEGDLLSATVRNADGEYCFGTKTNRGWSRKTTIIWRLDGKRRQRWRVAGVEWNSLGPSRVSFLRKEMELDVFLAPTHSATRTFTGPGGQRFTWTVQGKCMVLQQGTAGAVVARTRWSETGPSRERQIHLNIAPEAISALNAIFVTFLIMERTRRKQEHHTLRRH